MKKTTVIIISAVISAVFLFACSEPSADSGKLSVIASIFAPYDFARQIAGDRADVTMLLPPAAESHSFEPTAKDIVGIGSCGVFIYVGGESETWVERVLGANDMSGKQIITLMDCVQTVEEEIVDGMQTDGEPGEHEYDEHVWTSPLNAKLISARICEAMCEADPDNADYYRANAEAYLAELDALDAEFREIMANASRKTVIFGDRFPFRYFADAYGIEYYAAFPGCAAGTEPVAKTITDLIKRVNEEAFPVVFHIELSNREIAETIAEETGAAVMLMHSCHSVSKDDLENGATYISLMRANAANLKEALG